MHEYLQTITNIQPLMTDIASGMLLNMAATAFEKLLPWLSDRPVSDIWTMGNRLNLMNL